MQKLRKALVISVMAFTVLSMCVVTAPKADAAAKAGDLIKMNGLSSIYFLAADGKRYVFPNEATYFSWYGDFSGVVTISQSELEALPLGKNITIRPGTKLVKITTNPNVYAVTTGGVLVKVPDEATAKTLWGDNWAKKVVDVADAFFTNYTIGSGTVSATAYPAGSLIKYDGNPAVYYIAADGKARKIADEAAFNANRFKWSDIITAPASVTMPTAGTDLTGADSTLTDTSSGAGGTIGAGTGLTVALASDTPAAGNIPAGSPTEFTKINLTASNDGAVTVNGIMLTAFDLGTATYIDNATFYDNGVKVGTSKNFTSDRTASFNFTNLVVAAGATKTLVVKATIESGQTSGNFAIGISKAADITTNGASVSGSFPVRGNTKAVTNASIGTVTLGSDYDDLTVSEKFGTDSVLLAEFNLTAANEPVLWSSARFRNGGTNVDGILSNLKLVIDGDEVSTATGLNDKYIDFVINNYKIAKGDSVTVDVYGDLGIANVGNTIDLYVYQPDDFVFTGVDYGYGIEMAQGSGELDAASTGIKVTLASGDIALDMDKSATPSADVRAGTDGLVIGTLKVQSNGENVTINSIKENGSNVFAISGTGVACSEFDNARLKDKDTGTVYDMTMATSSIDSAKCALSMTDEISLVKGILKTFQILIDLNGPNDSAPIGAGDSFKVTLEDGAFSLTGDDSNSTSFTFTQSSVDSSLMTVKAASLDWTTTSLTSKSVVPGAKGVEIYQAQLEAGASSDVTVTSFKLTTVSDGSDVFTDNNISQFDVYLSGVTDPIKTITGQISEVTGGAHIGDTITLNNLGGKLKIAKGTTATLTVKANFASTLNPTGMFRLGVHDGAADILAKDIDNNNVVENLVSADAYSRDVTLAAVGTLKALLRTTDTKANKDTYILAGAETTKDKYMGEIAFTTTNEQIKVKTLVLEQASTTNSSDIKLVKLYDKTGAVVASKAPNASGHVNFDALNLTLPADQVTSYFVGIVTKTINADGDSAGTARYGKGAIYTFASSSVLSAFSVSSAITAQGVDSGTDLTMTMGALTLSDNQYSGNVETKTKEARITGAVLNSVTNAMSDGSLTGGTAKIIGKYKFVFDAGTNRDTANEAMKAQMQSLKLTFATSSVTTISNVKAYIDGDSGNKTDAGLNPGVGGTATINLTQLDGSEKVTGEVTLVIVADISGVGSNANLQTSIYDLTAGDFTFNGNAGTGAVLTNTLLNYSDVSGATLTN